MDNIEDDARYPPNPYPRKHRQPFSSSHRSKLPVRNSPFPPQIRHRYPEDDDDGGDQNDIDQPTYEIQEDNSDDDDDDDEDSSESRGKRRRLDKYAQGFEFAPRVSTAAIPSVDAPAKAPIKNSPADWSEDSTFVLLDAWGDLYVQNGRKSIRSDQWSEVAKKVSQASKTARSDTQCRNRLDTLKKKYKKEKASMAEHSSSSSKWAYFKKMEVLMSSPSPPPPPPATQQHSPPRLPCGVDAGEYVFTNSRVHLNRSNGVDEMRDSPGDTESEDGDYNDGDDESDGLPPTREKTPGRSFRMLADSIQKFGEIYEKIENSKRQQMAELERMRKEFHRDLEVQKRQILERAQTEIARITQEEGEEEEEEGEERIEDDDDDDDADEIDGSA